jgi:hypothetical protein
MNVQMAGTSNSKWRGIVAVAAIIALSLLARRPYLRETNLSPDAADYINIARNVAHGRGLTHSIKWHFFSAEPVIHSAIGERPLLYPLLLAPFCRDDYPARACQWVTMLTMVAALVLAAAWTRRMGLNWQAATIAVALLAFNPALAMCSIYPWTEPLYLAWLLGVMLVVGRDSDSPRAAHAACAAAFLTVLAYLTRASAPAIVAGLSLWYLYRRSYRALAAYLATLILLLIPWWTVVWVARGNPFYSIQSFHFIVNDIRDGMATGYGVVFPRPIGFLVGNAGIVLKKVAAHTLSYIGELFGPTYLSLLSVFVFLRIVRPRNADSIERAANGGPCHAIAFFHFLLPALTWATFDYVRFMAPCFVLLAVPAVAEMDELVGRLAARRARLAAWSLVLAAIAFFYADQWAQLYQQVMDGHDRDLSMKVMRIELDRIVPPKATLVCRDPFSCNYYFDRPMIVLPDAADSAQRLERLTRFLDEYHPDYLLLTPDEVRSLSPLIAAGRLQPVGALVAMDLRIFRVVPPKE